MSLTTMALNWCKTRAFDTSTIIGATTLEQLKENIDAFEPSVVFEQGNAQGHRRRASAVQRPVHRRLNVRLLRRCRYSRLIIKS